MKLSLRNTVLLGMMILSAGVGSLLRPKISMADERPPIELASMVPTTFGEWQEQTNLAAQVINPQQKETLEKIYSQTLSRTYVNREGYRIMLSIAYGKNQSDALQLHKPEVCYPAQGFTLISKQASSIELLGKAVEVTRLTTSLGQRSEPVTYWTVVGDQIVTTGGNKKLIEIQYAINNRIPDGMLVRFSSIDPEPSRAFAIQAKFAGELIRSIDQAYQSRFAGSSL